MLSESITINLFGKTYNFEADENVSNAQMVADFVEKEVASLAGDPETPQPRHIEFAMLTQAALNIANGFVEQKDKQADVLDKILLRTQSLNQKLDARL